MKTLDIAIAGAGPAGLAAALFLKRAGHRVTIFERFGQPEPVGSGLILQPTGLTVLGELGLFDEISALGSRIDRLYGADARSGRPVLDVRYSAQRGGRHGIAVHRAALFNTLHAAALREGIPIETGSEIASIDASGQNAVLFDAHEKRLGSFDLAIDSTGARSKLRQYSDVPVEQKRLTYGAFWASLKWPEGLFDERALLQRYRRASVMVGVLPIGRATRDGDKMAAFFWSLKPKDAEAVQARGLDAWKEQVLSIWPDCVHFTDQITSFDQLSLARYGHHTLKLPIGRKLAIIGDAAHSTSPQLGQGANMALLDAAALVHALEKGASIEEALGLYASARRWHMRVFQALSYAFTPFYQSDSVALPFIRDRLVSTLATIPPAPQFLASMVAGTIIDPFKAIGLRERDWTLKSADLAQTQACN
ncbi:NAD(P)/FAD-dependent oxidoreductase [Mesorhizobium sp. SB112]|uniref:FAD-dependent oxidoreductase n=1 Tax=Mesorhizobium sp. SB112 TaxID=3151853 RepID=UPI003265ED8D